MSGSGCLRRLWDALVLSTMNAPQVRQRDLAGLVRQALRREEEQYGARPALEVPRAVPWPSRSEWEDAGCEATELSDRRFLIKAMRWKPEWLPCPGDESPESPAFAESQRRAEVCLPGDGFLSVIGHQGYKAPGQRQAVRAVLASEPGATVLVNLPTGTGKSAVAHLPSILWGYPAGLSIVVVPTTALALDQERAVRAYPEQREAWPALLAFHEGLNQEERASMRSAIRDGSQRILFTSPESLAGTLAPAVFDAAERGFLRLLVFDEAHLVSQWGAEFRPEFQSVAGMRRALLDAAKKSGADVFRTLLLTATLTEDSFRTLRTLFGDPGPFECISAVTLRPEPSYWLARCEDESERCRRLLDAVDNLPRPLVLYVATTEQVSEYTDLLRAHGYGRLGTVLGTTSAADRKRVINGWRGDVPDANGVSRTMIDIVVATSAFGLGIDQSDVRTVLHACVPETIDRFYQEVGRGGRDGRACVSVLLWTEEDKGVARSLNSRRIISTERGFERWRSLFLRRQVVDGDQAVFRLPLDARPADIFLESNENRAWNLRTLTLMSRAGLLELRAEPPPSRRPDEEQEAWDARCEEVFRQYRNSAVVRLIEQGATDEEFWEHQCRLARAQTRSFDDRQLQAMFAALEGTPSICTALADAYRFTYDDVDGQSARVFPQPACGGCPDCRASGRAPSSGVQLSPPPLRRPQARLSPSLEAATSGASVLWVFGPKFSDHDDWKDQTVRFIEAAVRHGIRNVVGPAELRAEEAVLESFHHAPGRCVFLHEHEEAFSLPALPTLWIEPPSSGRRVSRDVLHRGSRRAPWIVLVSEDMLDPEHPTATAMQYRTTQLSLTQLLARL